MLTMVWSKSSFSSGNTDMCLEARLTDGGVEIRHSKRPEGPTITYSSTEWEAFLAGVKAGEFDA